ncbi:MAG TPA: permease [Candidatus Hydrogenedentes bacterium]|nr:permease [Candidatus Hydrogenedentota bacterium]HOV61450.1 permease [Candidatus Hydrogenedentota bacterium]
MEVKKELQVLGFMTAVFALFFWLPVDSPRFTGAVMEALQLSRWYAREHVLLCLVPAFFIAGAIGVFISQASVMKYLGAGANKVLAYGVASVSGSILAVCSCTVLPLFAGIWKMGAGLGPACAFLYSGPAINVLAIILTARILGMELGIARAVGAIGFSVIIGLLMHLIFRKEEAEKAAIQATMPEPEVTRPLWKNAIFFALMVGILVFANWGAPNDYFARLADGRILRVAVIQSPEGTADGSWKFTVLEGASAGQEMRVAASDVVERIPTPGIWTTLWQNKWLITSGLGVLFAAVLVLWLGVAWWKVLVAGIPPLILALLLPSGGMWVLAPFTAAVAGLAVITASQPGEPRAWCAATWGFARQIMPLLLAGVLVAGLLLGRPGHEGLIPSQYVQMLVGDSPDTFLAASGLRGTAVEGMTRLVWPLWTNLFASVFGAFMYFATLTEVPILQGLLGAGMGKGPALALLLAGPALSLPNMLVIRGIMGTKRAVVFCTLVVIMATLSGMAYGLIWR